VLFLCNSKCRLKCSEFSRVGPSRCRTSLGSRRQNRAADGHATSDLPRPQQPMADLIGLRKARESFTRGWQAICFKHSVMMTLMRSGVERRRKYGAS
jgi:hypothetical protein